MGAGKILVKCFENLMKQWDFTEILDKVDTHIILAGRCRNTDARATTSI